MLKGIVIANIITAVVTSLDNCSNPKRTPRHRDEPRPIKKPRFMSAPAQSQPRRILDLAFWDGMCVVTVSREELDVWIKPVRQEQRKPGQAVANGHDILAEVRSKAAKHESPTSVFVWYLAGIYARFCAEPLYR
jgi:hypothetical protein